MGRLTTILSVLVIIFSLAVCGIFYAKDTCSIIYNNVEIAMKAANSEDEKTLQKASETMLALMKKRHVILSLYVRHEELEEIEEKITILCKYCELKVFDDAKIYLIEIRFLAEKIYEREIITIDNLF